MPESTNQARGRSRRSTLLAVALAALPVTLAVVLFWLEPLEPAQLPLHELAGPALTAPLRNGLMLRGAEPVGRGALAAPEDLAYDAAAGVIYAGCADGWVKRVTVNDSVVEDWVNTGGRPLGLVLGRDGKLFVADSEKGILSISKEGAIELLSQEAEGLKFNLADGIDIAEDGILYFTDATHKYNLKDHIFDILEGKPHGRLLSFNPVTKETKVLLRRLYFANGVALSPDQTFLVFCETVMQRCRKYHLKGEKEGRVEPFAEKLPGMPDNVRYDDGRGLFWIALATEVNPALELALRYPIVRKAMAILERYIGRPNAEGNGGVFAVDFEGKPVYHFHDPALSSITTGIRVGDHLYCGSVAASYILRLNLLDYPARPHT